MTTRVDDFARHAVAQNRRVTEALSAMPATNVLTGRPPPGAVVTTTQSSVTTPGTPISTASGPADGASAPADPSPTSSASGAPSQSSKRRWRQPRDAGDLAVQASRVATMVLNGDIDPDTARLYVSGARVAAQAMSTKVTKARFLGTEPDLTLDGEVFEDG